MGGFPLPPGWSVEPDESEAPSGRAPAYALPAGWTVEPDAPEEEAFPTPGETAATMIGSGLQAIPGMIAGTAKTAYDIAQLVSGEPETGRRYAQESIDHVQAAMDPTRSAGDRVGEAVSAIPVAGPMVTGLVKQAGRAFTPAYRAVTGGVSRVSGRELADAAVAGAKQGVSRGQPILGAARGVTEAVMQAGSGQITPQEMREAATAGGEGVAALALPSAVKGAGKVAGAVLPRITPKTVATVLKFTAKATAGDVTGAAGVLGKAVVGDVLTRAAGKLGEIAVDGILNALQRRNLPAAVEAIAKAAEKSPEVAKIAAEAAAKAEGAAPTPFAGPYTGTWDSPRPSRPIPPAPEPPAPPVPPVDHRSTIPPKGKSRIPTTFTPPERIGPPKPTGPLTSAQRKLQIDQIRAAQEAGLDIFEAFGTKPKAAPVAIREGPAGTTLVQVVGPNGDRIVIAAKKGAKGGSDFDPNVPRKAGKHELQSEKLTRRLGDESWVEALKAQGFTPDEAMGFAHFGPNPKSLNPGMVYVAPEFQRMGIATAMYDAAKNTWRLPIGKGAQRPDGIAFRSAYDARSN